MWRLNIINIKQLLKKQKINLLKKAVALHSIKFRTQRKLKHKKIFRKSFKGNSHKSAKSRSQKREKYNSF